MNKEKEKKRLLQLLHRRGQSGETMQTEEWHDATSGEDERCDCVSGDAEWLDEELEGLRSAKTALDEMASRMQSPLTEEQMEKIYNGEVRSQYYVRREADRYLLVFSLLVVALTASILYRTVDRGLSILNVCVVAVGVVGVWVAVRAAYSLWLMRKADICRCPVFSMAHNFDCMERFSQHRKWWVDMVCRNGGAHIADEERGGGRFVRDRIPSYSIAACLFLLIALNSGQAFAATGNFVDITTTTEQTDVEIYSIINNMVVQI